MEPCDAKSDWHDFPHGQDELIPIGQRCFCGKVTWGTKDDHAAELARLRAALAAAERERDALAAPLPCGHAARYSAVDDGTLKEYCLTCLLEDTKRSKATIMDIARRQHKRGDTYRARALALLALIRRKDERATEVWYENGLTMGLEIGRGDEAEQEAEKCEARAKAAERELAEAKGHYADLLAEYDALVFQAHNLEAQLAANRKGDAELAELLSKQTSELAALRAACAAIASECRFSAQQHRANGDLLQASHVEEIAENIDAALLPGASNPTAKLPCGHDAANIIYGATDWTCAECGRSVRAALLPGASDNAAPADPKIDALVRDAVSKATADLRAALTRIQEMADDDINDGSPHTGSNIWQIEADARAALLPGAGEKGE